MSGRSREECGASVVQNGWVARRFPGERRRDSGNTGLACRGFKLDFLTKFVGAMAVKLEFVEFAIPGAAFDEVGVSTFAENLTVVEEDDLVCRQDGGEPVGDGDDSLAA